MKLLFKKSFVILFSFCLIFVFSFPCFASSNNYSIDLNRSDFWIKSNAFVFAQDGSHVTILSPDGNTFITDSNGATFFRSRLTDFSASSSDIVYGFRLSSVLLWDSSNANFSISGSFDNSGYGVNNRPDKYGVFVMPVSDYFQFQFDYLANEGYKAFSDIPDALLTAYNNQSSSSYRIYGAQVGSGSVFSFDFRCITPEVSDDLALVFVAYAGSHNNFCFFPKSLTLTPYSGSLSQMRDNERYSELQSGIDSINNGLNGEGESYSSVNSSSLDDFESLEDSLNKDFGSDLSNALDSSVFTGSGAFSFIKSCFENLILSNPVISSLIFFALSMGLVVLILSRKVGSS